MELKTTNKSQVEEVPYGMYVWQLPDGEILGDDDGNVMNVFSHRKDPKAVKAIIEAARYYGYPEGKVLYWSGRRPISDEELAMQEERARQGLVPDPLDIGAIRDEERALKQNDGKNR